MGKSFKDWLTEEDRLQASVNKYIALKGGDVLFFHTPNEGKRTKFEQFKAKFMGLKKGVPDIVILEPRDEYSGLLIELKKEGTVVWNKNGTVRKNLIDQEAFLSKAREKGYMAEFAVGFDQAKDIIDNYFRL